MNRVDRERLRAAFSSRAGAYAAAAPLQREVARATLRRALGAAPGARRFLDVGCGPGLLLEELRTVRPDVSVAGLDLAPGMVLEAARRLPGAALLVGDAESLPFAGGAFDLVVSTSTFQWLGRLDQAFSEARRVLRPGGLLALSLFGDGTLAELREAWTGAVPGGADGLHRFFGPGEVRDALSAAGFSLERLDEERHVEWHDGPRDLLRSLREIGAGNAVPGRAGGLGVRGAVLEMERRYASLHGREGRVPATWVVIQALARAP